MALTSEVFKVYATFVDRNIAGRSDIISEPEKVRLLAAIDGLLRTMNPPASDDQRRQVQVNLVEDIRIHNVAVSGAPGPSLGIGSTLDRIVGTVGGVVDEAVDKAGSLLTVIAIITVAIAVIAVTVKSK
jgi:hypothetical protein